VLIASEPCSTHPMVYYALSALASEKGDADMAAQYGKLAAEASPDYCFPARLEEMRILEGALRRNPDDAKAAYYLGNLYYDKKRYEDAIALWEKSVALDEGFSIPWRNLGIAYFNVRRNPQQALSAYERAHAVCPQDARVFYELDQLRKRIGFAPKERLAFFEKLPALVSQRDDLTVELVTLYNQTGQPGKAIEILLGRRFHPWEGGEGLVSGQYVWAHRLLGISCLNDGSYAEALENFSAARIYPQSLGEGKHLLVQEFDLDYLSGVALREMGKDDLARAAFTAAAEGDAVSSWMSYYKALALRSLGRTSDMLNFVEQWKGRLQVDRQTEARIDYFATSLPNFLVFEDDLVLRKEIEDGFGEALLDLALGNDASAIEKLQQVLTKDPNHLAAQTMLVQASRGGDRVFEARISGQAAR
jgi:tetratricopeptide (TPR) repeat protein